MKLKKVTILNIIKIFPFLLICLIFFPIMTIPVLSEVYYPGEELTYEVSFIGIKLGAIRVIIQGQQNIGNKKVIKAKCWMNSYRGIPFVTLSAIFDSWMDPSLAFSHKFEGSNKRKDGSWDFEKIQFDYENQQFKWEAWYNNKLDSTRMIKSYRRWNDGLALFFFARQNVYAKRLLKVPTVMQLDTSFTYINFSGKTENVEINAVDYPVRTVYFNGKADWKGVYGVTGSFEGWFSDDDARVPILAKMQLYLGNADIKLIKWSRGSWSPPRAN